MIPWRIEVNEMLQKSSGNREQFELTANRSLIGFTEVLNLDGILINPVKKISSKLWARLMSEFMVRFFNE